MTAHVTDELAPPVPVPHAEAYQLFTEVRDFLLSNGWTYRHVDTLVRADADPRDRKQWTIRHQYDAGTWELHFEPDRHWNRGVARHKAARTVRIRRDRPPLPTVSAVISELFDAKLRANIRPVATTGE